MLQITQPSQIVLLYTLLENLKLCPKIQFSEKKQNCEFDFSCPKIMN